MGIGKNIKAFRLKKGLSQKKLGELSNINPAQIRRYELEGANSTPKLETLRKISNALEVPIWELLDMSKQDALLFYNNHTPYDTDSITKAFEEDILSENNFKRITKAYKLLNNKGKYEAMKQIVLLSKIPEYQKNDE